MSDLTAPHKYNAFGNMEMEPVADLEKAYQLVDVTGSWAPTWFSTSNELAIGDTMEVSIDGVASPIIFKIVWVNVRYSHLTYDGLKFNTIFAEPVGA